MNPLALFFFLACAAALISVPRKWAPVPLLIGCTYMTLGQGIHLGPISLPVYRMLLLVGAIRVYAKSEALPGGFNRIDKLMLAWGGWVIFASFFHDPVRAGPIYACGQVFNQTLIYFLIRVWCTELEEVGDVIRIVALLLVPIAIEMLVEKATSRNSFAIFGGVPDWVVIREGRLRAQGPFRHPILAGTVGATCIPLFIGILKHHRLSALTGIGAGVVMVFASASSGPVMSLIAGAGALVMWHFKNRVKALRLGAMLLYVGLMFTMDKPPYYLISRIDISGGSTGWHRAFLIEQTFSYLSEWWLFGTDETRHWMPMQGIANDPHHTDVTNYYIGFGVTGGLAAMALVIWMMGVAFRWVGEIHDARIMVRPNQSFMIWCFGACLFSHAVTSFSVAYFDQSMLYFWLSVAVISSVYSIIMLTDQSAAPVTDCLRLNSPAVPLS
ncbi:MAG: hypothetical protein WCJ14_03885 [Verrucomicrobiota bacterium]